jgi:hypothetical protein
MHDCPRSPYSRSNPGKLGSWSQREHPACVSGPSTSYQGTPSASTPPKPLGHLAGGSRAVRGGTFSADSAHIPHREAEPTAFRSCCGSAEHSGVPFNKRVGRLLEGLRLARALWSGQPVNWDGRWKVEKAVLGPTPCRAGGPPIWIGGSLPASLERAGRYFDGWLPISPDAQTWGKQWKQVQEIARAAGATPMH